MSGESTTPDLVVRVRESLEAVNRRDFDTAYRIYSPDVVWDASRREVARFDSRAAWRNFLEEWLSPYEEWKLEVEEIADLGNGVLFATVCQTGRLIGTEGDLEMRDAWVCRWEKGLIVEVTVYLDPDEARAAAERLAEERADG
jgi:ketosteroid isomerase-like protein